jgi:GAF domain-containing protein
MEKVSIETASLVKGLPMAENTPSYEQLAQRNQECESMIRNLKHSEKQLIRRNRVLNTLRNVNQLLSKEKDRHRLLYGICDNLVENRGYSNAWIAIFDESGDLLEWAESGLGEAFLPMVDRFKRGEMTSCGRKARTRSGTILTGNPYDDCNDCPLAKTYGNRSAMTVRIEHNGIQYGILSVSIPRDFAVDQEEQQLLEEVSEDIAFGLHAIELEEEHYRADEALRESEQRFRDLIACWWEFVSSRIIA